MSCSTEKQTETGSLGSTGSKLKIVPLVQYITEEDCIRVLFLYVFICWYKYVLGSMRLNTSSLFILSKVVRDGMNINQVQTRLEQTSSWAIWPKKKKKRNLDKSDKGQGRELMCWRCGLECALPGLRNLLLSKDVNETLQASSEIAESA